MNNLKTGVLLTVLTVLLVLAGSSLGGQQGAIIAFALALAMNAGAYWMSDKLVLRMYKAQQVSEAQSPELYGVVADLAQRAQLPMPKVYVIPGEGLNAFATGRNPEHAAVAVTEGLLANLDRSELQGVLAHELSHVKHRDILIGTIAATLAGAISVLGSLARWGAILGGSRDNNGSGGLIGVFLVSIVAGMAATIVQLAVSRSREYEADAGAARLLGDPNPLISALRKLDFAAQRVPMHANQATAHMFIVSPLSGGGVMKWFSTHPPIEERIQRLQGLVGIR
jgi:heat shock protein HtpX